MPCDLDRGDFTPENPRPTENFAEIRLPLMQGLASVADDGRPLSVSDKSNIRDSSKKIYIIQCETGLDGVFVPRILRTKEKSGLGQEGALVSRWGYIAYIHFDLVDLHSS